MLTLCLLFYAQALVYSVATLLAFTSVCKQKDASHSVLHEISLSPSVSSILYTVLQYFLAILYATDYSKTTLASWLNDL